MAELSKAAREARAAYLREWRRKNPEKVKLYEERRWERIAKKIAEEANNAQKERGCSDDVKTE